MNSVEQLVAVVSVLLTLAALIGAWWNWRRNELRREDVLGWGSEAIAVLQTLLLICIDDEHAACGPNPRLTDLRFQSSILVERGRLFFRNANPDGEGSWKEPAYRGNRPYILDYLVVAHQIATQWPEAVGADRSRMRLVADDILKKFVSLLQKEVGRDRTASADTRRGGDGANLRQLMAEIDPSRLPIIGEERCGREL